MLIQLKNGTWRNPAKVSKIKVNKIKIGVNRYSTCVEVKFSESEDGETLDFDSEDDAVAYRDELAKFVNNALGRLP